MSTTANDIPADLLASRDFATRVSAAYELTKPRMNFLVLVTTAVGFYVAAGPQGTLAWMFLHVLFGTALTAAGASVLNQFLERDVDALMPRTARRPLPAGQLSPAFALGFGILLGLAGTVYLAWLVNPLSAALALFTLLSYAFVYTPLKRRTPWCTLVGAVPGAIPPMIGDAAATGSVGIVGWSLFLLMMAWQMPHFFGLATMYRNDYAAGGFRMLPGEVGGQERTARQVRLFAFLTLGLGLLPALADGVNWIYAVAAFALGIWFLKAALEMASLGTRASARRLFVVSILHLPLLLLALVVDRTLPV